MIHFALAPSWAAIFALIAILLGLHYLYFKNEANTVVEALTTWQGLHVVYWLFAIAVGERIHRRLVDLLADAGRSRRLLANGC